MNQRDGLPFNPVHQLLQSARPKLEDENLVTRGVNSRVHVMAPENQLALIVALFLSKFDVVALQALGYASWSDCYADVAARLEVKSTTIKHMRDHFDPYYPNPRVGWYQRPMLPSRIETMQQFGELSLASFTKLVQTILQSQKSPAQLEPVLEQMKTPLPQTDKSPAEKKKVETEYINSRGLTGRLAEKYFMELFHAQALPFQGNLIDRRDDGCGYDFLIEGDVTQAVEVKGLGPLKGNLLFTNREWETSQKMKNYAVFVAFNLADKKDAWGQRIINNADLVKAVKVEQTVVQTSWRFVPDWK